MAEVCKICEGAGMRVVERADGARVAQRCVCQQSRIEERAFARARIPAKFINCTFDNYMPDYEGLNESLGGALITARAFVNRYPLETKGKGLMLVGNVGTGKTHLAVSLLKALVVEKDANALFYDCTNLLEDIKNTYDKGARQSEREMLAPVFNADVLVLDELGAAKITDWSFDTIARVINARYNGDRVTIVTTNYPNIPALGSAERDTFAPMREETLGDRIGERMRSRLQEMCTVVELFGNDYRQKSRRSKSRLNKKPMPKFVQDIATEETILQMEQEERNIRMAREASQPSKPAITEGGITGARSIAKFRGK